MLSIVYPKNSRFYDFFIVFSTKLYFVLSLQLRYKLCVYGWSHFYINSTILKSKDSCDVLCLHKSVIFIEKRFVTPCHINQGYDLSLSEKKNVA